MYHKIVYIVSLIYIFTIIAFGDSSSMYVVSNGVFAVLLGLISIYVLKASPNIPTKVFIFLPFCLFCFTSIIWSYRSGASQTRALTILSLNILFVALAVYILKTESAQAYINGLAICGIMLLVYVVRVYGISGLSSAIQEGERVGGEIVNENTLAIFLSISVVVLLYNFYKKRKVFYLLLLLPVVLIVALTGSKKGLLDLVVGFVLVSLLMQKDSEGVKKYLKILLMIAIGCVLFYFAWNLPIFAVVRDRFELMFSFLGGSSSRIDYSTQERQIMIEYGLKQFFNTPILGIGVGATGYITELAVGFNTYLHNNYVELLASVGLVGFILYYIPIIILLAKCWKYRKESDSSLICFVILCIQVVNDYASVSYFSKTTYILFAISWAVVAGIERNKKKYISTIKTI